MRRTVRLTATLLLLVSLLGLPALTVQAESPSTGWSLDWLQHFVHWILGPIGSASTTADQPADQPVDCSEACPTPSPDPTTDTTTSTATPPPPPPEGETYPLKDPNG